MDETSPVVVLATTHHNPGDKLIEQLARTIRPIADLFLAITVVTNPGGTSSTLELFDRVGMHIVREDEIRGSSIGLARLYTLAAARQLDTDFIFFCDLDRLVHWHEHYPKELVKVLACIQRYDFTVLGRTHRAFDSHPRIQRDTEAIINFVFGRVSGHTWDVTAAAHGISVRAADLILTACHEVTVGPDVAWPLRVDQDGGLTMGYLETEVSSLIHKSFRNLHANGDSCLRILLPIRIITTLIRCTENCPSLSQWR